MVSRDNALISSHPGGLTPGSPRTFAPRHLQILPQKRTKRYRCPSPREHHLKRLPNCNVISCIIFNKSLTITSTVSKSSQSTCFLYTTRFSFLYLLSHRMAISTNIPVHLLRPVFTILHNYPAKSRGISSDTYSIACCFPHLCTLAHHCHGKRINLTAK